MKTRLILLNKPYLVLCQFTDADDRDTLASYLPVPGLYPAGRLDYDSEGLVILTSAGWLQHLIAHPGHKLWKTYWVQVEGIPGEADLARLEGGIEIKGKVTRPAQARLIDPPAVWPRTPPIRERVSIPTSWLEIRLAEGRKRQVRHMTAEIGFPTLRLIRSAIGPWQVGSLEPGKWQELPAPVDSGAYFKLVRRYLAGEAG